MTGEIERELTARVAYVEAARVHGSEHFLVKLPGGWSAKTWTGVTLQAPSRKRGAIARVQGHVGVCAKRITELRAQLVAAAYDAEMAAVSPEERLAGARAQQAAIDGPRWRRKSA